MPRLRHALLIARDIASYSRTTRRLWLIPLVLLLGLASLIVFAGQAVAPVAIYPLF